MANAIYSGTLAHTRHIPKKHSFCYPFFMWYLDLEELDKTPSLGLWFSSTRFALSRFRRSDYLVVNKLTLAHSIRNKMEELTGSPVSGKIFGLLNVRTLGLYFSPVNFYYGFDQKAKLTHLPAEVSNTPWNEKHYYALLEPHQKPDKTSDKVFKVSPFNPEKNQQYQWKISPPSDHIAVNLGVYDERGHVFEAALRLEKKEFTPETAKRLLLRTPVMTANILFKVYWQALKLYLKGVPFIPYEKENA